MRQRVQTIPQTPRGIAINAMVKFSIDEVAAILKPEQMHALLNGIGKVVAAAAPAKKEG